MDMDDSVLVMNVAEKSILEYPGNESYQKLLTSKSPMQAILGFQISLRTF